MAGYAEKNRRKGKVLGGLLLALIVTLFAVTIALEMTDCQTLVDPTNPRPAIAYGYLTIHISGLAFGILGLLVVGSQPRNRIGWLMLLTGLSFGVISLVQSYSICSIRGQESLPFGEEIFWFLLLFFNIAFLSLILLLLLFPNGHLLSRRWGWVAALLTALIAITVILRQFVPGQIGESTLITAVTNPFSIPFLEYPGLGQQLELLSTFLATLLMFLAVAQLVMRWRRSGSETRQQIKWFVYYAAIFGTLFFVVELIGLTLYPPIFDGWFYLFEITLFFIGLPVVVAIAVLKYRLYDIDVIIRRTLQYGLLTAVLIAVYFGVVLLVQTAFVAVTGQESPIAIVISTLVIAALFNPLRQRIQSFIDRRFYRRSYDAAYTLRQFAQTARDEVDLEQLSEALLQSIQETVQPRTTVLWLADKRLSQLGDEMGQ